jgi:hypothetical protein
MVALRDFVFAFCLLLSVAAAQRTVDDIFNNINKNYNKNVMPPSRRGQPVMVGITVMLSKVSMFGFAVATFFRIQIQWTVFLIVFD